MGLDSITSAEWTSRACSLRIARSRGKPAPYQPAMLLAAVVLVHKRRFADNRISLGEIEATFGRVMELVAPTSRAPDSTQMPFKALINAGIWGWHAVEGYDQRLAAALAQNAGPREVLGLLEYVSLPAEVFDALTGYTDFAQRTVTRLVDCYRSVFKAHGFEDLGRGELLELVGVVAPLVAEPDRATLDERGVEELIGRRWATTPFGGDYPVLRRQFPTPVNTVDLLASSASRDRHLVIELKHGRHTDAAVGQLSRYLGWVTQHKVRGDASRVRGVLLTDFVDERIRCAVRGHGRAELWRYGDALQIERVA